jgi:hypothetical protein
MGHRFRSATFFIHSALALHICCITPRVLEGVREGHEGDSEAAHQGAGPAVRVAGGGSKGMVEGKQRAATCAGDARDGDRVAGLTKVERAEHVGDDGKMGLQGGGA